MYIRNVEILIHGHHIGLLSVCSLAVRLETIKYKPIHEQPLRARLIQSVPLSMLPGAVILAAKALDKAAQAWREALDKPDEPLDKLDEAWDEAEINFSRICAVYKNELELLHLRLCVLDCPWDGERLIGIGD